MDLPVSASGRPARCARELPGHVVERIAELAAGDQPVSAYVYDLAMAQGRARDLRAVLPDWAGACYAVKANGFPPLLAALAAEVDGFEVASAREIDLAHAAALDAGRAGVRLVASGPAKTDQLLAALVAAGVDAVNVESVLELHRLARAAERAGVVAPAALRVNPRRVAVTGSLRMGGAATQFGIPEDDVPAALAVARSLPSLDVVGFHVHAVSQNLDAAAHAAYVRWCLDWSARTAAAHAVDLRLVDAGGGLGVAFEGEEPFDLEVFGGALAGIDPPAGVRLVIEPGRWMVAGCGWYAAEVVDVKHAYGTWYVVVRGGIDHFQLPTSWDVVHNFAVFPIERWPYACPRPELRAAPVTVAGELCTTEDVLARDVVVERVRPGDVVVFPDAGSYGWEFAMHRFLGHPVADRVVCRVAGG